MGLSGFKGTNKNKRAPTTTKKLKFLWLLCKYYLAYVHDLKSKVLQLKLNVYIFSDLDNLGLYIAWVCFTFHQGHDIKVPLSTNKLNIKSYKNTNSMIKLVY